jgi:hypothetical protein
LLVTHAVLEAKEAAGRMIVLTLGSPLRLLSHIFPRQIRTPDRLLAAYSETGTVLCWANLWRDRDVIGRELKPAAADRFAETSIGDGVHWDMWHDRRVWTRVDELLGVSSFASLQTAWHERQELLSDDEAWEAFKLWRAFSVFIMLAPPTFVGIIALTYRTGFDEQTAMKLPLVRRQLELRGGDNWELGVRSRIWLMLAVVRPPSFDASPALSWSSAAGRRMAPFCSIHPGPTTARCERVAWRPGHGSCRRSVRG